MTDKIVKKLRDMHDQILSPRGPTIFGDAADLINKLTDEVAAAAQGSRLLRKSVRLSMAESARLLTALADARPKNPMPNQIHGGYVFDGKEWALAASVLEDHS